MNWKTKLLWSLLLSGFAFSCGLFHVAIAQTKKENLASRKEEISKEISKTKKLIKEYQGQQKSVANEIALINDEIALREQLIAEYKSDATRISANMNLNESEILSLNEKIALIKKEYAEMVYNGFKHRGIYSKLAFLLSAKDFYQAIRRADLLRQYSEHRKGQLGAIQNATSEILTIQGSLEEQRIAKIELGNFELSEKNEIAVSRSEQESKLQQLKSEEGKLREVQKKQEKERQQLTSKIQEIIRQEAEAERKIQEQKRKAELNRITEEKRIAEEKRKADEKKKQELALNSKKESENNKTEGTVSSTTKEESVKTETIKIERAPETVAANQVFEKNKGSLPWPIASGAIQSKFGRHPHESIKGLEVNNNGLDFLTSGNAEVKSVFSGKVTSVFNIPGAGYNIIITHGTYKTVYSGLSSSNVSVGGQVSAGQVLGNVIDSGDGYILHFELWRINESGVGAPQNPELWIKRR